jgi:hypothetical protein
MQGIFLDRIDAAPLADDDFSFSFNSWVSNIVDTLNESLNTIQNQLNGISLGLVAPSLTTDQITALTMPTDLNNINLYRPNGTIWFNTTLSKLQVQTAIVLGTGATVETITSV